MRNKINYHEHDEPPEMYPNISNVASVGETTGMMPTPPQNADEYASYQDMASMEIPKTAPGKYNNIEKRKTSHSSDCDNRSSF